MSERPEFLKQEQRLGLSGLKRLMRSSQPPHRHDALSLTPAAPFAKHVTGCSNALLGVIPVLENPRL